MFFHIGQYILYGNGGLFLRHSRIRHYEVYDVANGDPLYFILLFHFLSFNYIK